MKLSSWFIPQEKQFFDMILRQAENVSEGVDALAKLLEDYDERERWKTELNRLEGLGDRMAHEIFDELNRSFITPIDREDIMHLVSTLDDILDYVEAVGVSLVLYGIEAPTPTLTEMVRTLQRGAAAVRSSITLMKDFDNADSIRELIREINTHENEADALHRRAMLELFKLDDAVYIIKMKEIYDNTETAADMCEDVADVLNDILVKYA